MRRFRKKLLGSILVLAVVLTGALVTLVFQRTRLVQTGLNRVLEGTELREARMTIDRIGLEAADFSGIVLDGGYWRIEAESMRVRYDWKRRRIERLETGPARVSVDLDAALAEPSGTTLDEKAARLEEIRRSLPDIPFTLGKIEAVVRFRGVEERFELSGTGRIGREALLEGIFGLTGTMGRMELEVGRSDRESPMLIRGKAVTDGDPLAVVDRFLPDWRDRLPPSLGVDGLRVGLVEVDFRLEQERLRPISFRLEGVVNEVGATIRGHRVVVDRITAEVQTGAGEDPDLSVGLNGVHVASGDLRIEADAFSVRATLGKVLMADVPSIGFKSGEVAGHLGLSFTAAWPEAGRLPGNALLKIDVDQLETGGHSWLPFRIAAGIEAGALVVDLPRLQSSRPAWPVLSDLLFRAPLQVDGVAELTGEGRVVFSELSAGASGVLTGSDLVFSAAISGLTSESPEVDLRIRTPEGGGAWTVPGEGLIEAEGQLSASMRSGRSGQLTADLRVDLGPSLFRSSSGVVELASLALTAGLPGFEREELTRLPGAPLSELLRFASAFPMALEVVGDRLELPGGLQAEWFDLSCGLGEEETEAGLKPILKLSFESANLTLGSEKLNSVVLRHEWTFDQGVVSGSGRVDGLFDGTPFGLAMEDQISLGPEGGWNQAEVALTMDPLVLEYSDVLARHLPRFPGLSLTARIDGDASLRWRPGVPWDGSGRLVIRDGSVFYPAQNARLEGMESTLVFTSLRNLMTPPGQVWSFARLAVTDLELRDGRVVFGLSGLDRVEVSELSFETFKGRFRAEPFVYSIPDQSMDLVLKVDGLDAGAVVDHLNFFDGRIEGRLNGSIPFHLEKGRFTPRRGHLEIDGSVPAVFSYEADGLLTRGEPSRTLVDNLRLLPLRLAEEGLKDLQVERLTVDLFDPESPETPVRIFLSGEAVTSEAVIPYVITTNVNGTVAELLNFLFRLSSL